MEERKFIRALNVLKEEDTKINMEYVLFERIRREKFKWFAIRTAFITPLVFIVLFEVLKFVQKLQIFRTVIALPLLKNIIMKFPLLSLFAYLYVASVLASMLISMYIGGGEDVEMLLSPG